MKSFEESKNETVAAAKNEKPEAMRRAAEYYPHLNEGVSPIMASFETEENSDDEENLNADAIDWEKLPFLGIADNVDYCGDPDVLKKKDCKNAGWDTYAISPVDSADKFSKDFWNCTGVAAAGIDKATGGTLSFLSHQYPGYFLKNEENRHQFISDLDERLSELKERCAEGTVDAVIIGGNYITDEDREKFAGILNKVADAEAYRKDYRASIELLSSAIKKTLGFEPAVMSDPKKLSRENVYFKNDTRKLVIARKKNSAGDGNEFTGTSFTPPEMKDREKKW